MQSDFKFQASPSNKLQLVNKIMECHTTPSSLVQAVLYYTRLEPVETHIQVSPGPVLTHTRVF